MSLAIPPRLDVDAQLCGLEGDAEQRVEECRLGDFDRLSISRKNNVLVVHLHPGGEEIARRIAKAHRVNNRHCRADFRTVDPKLARLAPIDEDRARIGHEVEQSASSRTASARAHEYRQLGGTSRDAERR